MVREIEDLPANLQPASFPEANVSRQTGVEIEVPGTEESISPQVTVAVRTVGVLRYRERRGIQPHVSRRMCHGESPTRQGTASWAPLRSLYASSECPALEPGYACLSFSEVQIPRDVGFRFRYASQGSGIASGTSPAKNFTWTAGS